MKTTSTKIKKITETLPNRVTLETVCLPGGEFFMGSSDKKFQRQAKVSSFAIGKYPVTQAQYEAVMGTNPSYFKNNLQNPVENITWNDAQAFCKKLSGMTNKNYRLPTEAEWEYACRAGTTTDYYFGDDENQLGDYAWFDGNSNNTTHPVGQFSPNTFGLYDMHGNVHEWCQEVVMRGGSWRDGSNYCFSRIRIYNMGCDSRAFTYGFRVVFDVVY